MHSIEQSHYQILQIIYSVVKEDSYPLKCQLHPREIILRSMQDWSAIQSSLTILEREGLVATRKLDTLQISLTEKGLEMCRLQQ